LYKYRTPTLTLPKGEGNENDKGKQREIEEDRKIERDRGIQKNLQ